jgi:SH3 domain-containing YSC84-like protein 1
MKTTYGLIAATLAMALTLVVSTTAQAETRSDSARVAANGTMQHSAPGQDRINDAVRIVEQMKRDPHLGRLLEQSHGVFIVPHYAKAALVVGGQGGGGLLLKRNQNQWSDPAFYNIGGGSIGLQAGGEGGAIAMLLMTQKAIDKFENTNSTWSLGASAGLTVVTYSAKARGETGNGDVVLWSDTNGLFGGLNVNVVDIAPDTGLDHKYYGAKVDQREILSGSIQSPNADALRQALPTRLSASR